MGCGEGWSGSGLLVVEEECRRVTSTSLVPPMTSQRCEHSEASATA